MTKATYNDRIGICLAHKQGNPDGCEYPNCNCLVNLPVKAGNKGMSPGFAALAATAANTAREPHAPATPVKGKSFLKARQSLEYRREQAALRSRAWRAAKKAAGK